MTRLKMHIGAINPNTGELQEIMSLPAPSPDATLEQCLNNLNYEYHGLTGLPALDAYVTDWMANQVILPELPLLDSLILWFTRK